MREQQRQALVKAVAVLRLGVALYTDWRDGVRA